MKKYVFSTAFAILLTVCLLYQSPGQTSAPSPGGLAGSTLQQSDDRKQPDPSRAKLECQGCHAGGRVLPYLGGALFHADVHNSYDRGFHARALQNGRKAATCVDCHAINGDLTTLLPASDPKSPIHRANLAVTCGKCHGDSAVMRGTDISDRPFLSYQESVHARAVAHGNLSAAVCTDCHNSHDILPASDPESLIFKPRISATCGTCHASIAAEFNQSVHGKAVARGVSRSPGCTDCHGIHSIISPLEPGTRTATQRIASTSCEQCHAGVTLTTEFGVAAGRVSSYKDSYHGLASRLGSKTVANCASCHGVHNILPSSDPASMIHAKNLAQTCGQCHPGAGDNFAQGRIHLYGPEVTSADMATIGTTWVRRIYLPLIFLVIGGMVIHNALIWRKKAHAKRLHPGRTIVRLTTNQRIQHWLLLSSFIVLVISGFALQYPDSWFAWLLGSSEAIRRISHRVAAVVMMVAGVYHIAYLLLAKEGKSWLRDMLPKGKDVRDLLQNVGYYLGIKKQKPKLARFGYPEKAEYWAVVWGTIIMAITGLVLWFKLGVFGFLPRWWLDVALAIHFYEAVLATLAIVVWHFYHVIFDPDVYPINWAFYDGRESEEHYKEEHELHYEQLIEEQRKASEEQALVAESSELDLDGGSVSKAD